MAKAADPILAHLVFWVVMVVAWQPQGAPCVLGVAGRNQEFCFGPHEEAVAVDRRELVSVVVLELGRRRMVVGRRVWIHGLLARNRRWLPLEVSVVVVDQG